MKKINYKIFGKGELTWGLWFFILGLLYIFLLGWGWFVENWHTYNLKVQIAMILATLFCWVPFYMGLFSGIYIKILQINNSGVQYLLNNKIKKEILWQDIKKVYSSIDGKVYNLFIEGNNKNIKFNNTLYNASVFDLKAAFNEILKYKSKYNFKVIDKAGWSKK